MLPAVKASATQLGFREPLFPGRTIGLPTNVLHLGGEVASYPGPNRLHAEDAVEALSEALPAVKASAGQS